jgi:ribosomal protein S18 acetylase RimI-like enzyme
VEAARPAGPADLERLDELAAQGIAAQRGERGGAIWSQREIRSLPSTDDLALALDDPARLVVVGTIDDAVVGFGVAEVEELRTGARLAVVTDLWVEPEARGVGVGEAVMDLLVAWAEDHACIGIDALALPGDRATKNFFERFGLKARAIVVHRALGPHPGA